MGSPMFHSRQLDQFPMPSWRCGAMQIAILNCCITVGQEVCHLLLGGLESAQPVHEAVKNLFIISAAANAVPGICAFFLHCGQKAPEGEKSSMEDNSTESEDVSA